jgi:HD superfamily phosphohydrolase
MLIKDQLYGEYEFPDYVGELLATSLMQRTKDISQDVLPGDMRSWSVPSRYVHCLGVCRNMCEVIERNLEIASYATSLCVSSLLHDAGNPALSHLSEPFLMRLLGKDGESFLGNLIARHGIAPLIERIGISVERVLSMVTGSLRPLATVLHGSMDVDNLDNVLRYWMAHHPGERRYDPLRIASAFRFDGQRWYLQDSAVEQVKAWQATRKDVYGIIYGDPNLNGSMMIYRAVSLAFDAGELNEDFFALSDTQAIDFLRGCNQHTRYLVQQACAGDLYPVIFCYETVAPDTSFESSCLDADGRTLLANSLCEQLGIPPGAICVYLGIGRDIRSIDLPFIGDDRAFTLESTASQIFRCKIFLDPNFRSDRARLVRIVKGIL